MEKQIHGGQDIHNNLNSLIEDFSVTTNYLGPSIKGINHIKQSINLINHYPKLDQEPFKKNIIDFLFKNIKSVNEFLLFGNGASELIELTIRISFTPLHI